MFYTLSKVLKIKF